MTTPARHVITPDDLDDDDEFADPDDAARDAAVADMVGRAKDEIAELHAAAVADLRQVAHMLREGSALLPDGPWFTWLYEGGADHKLGDELGDPEWAIRAGRVGQHTIVRARASHTTALAYLAMFPPQFARSLATRLERTATRVESDRYAWTTGDIGLLQIARTYLEGLQAR